MVKKSKIKLSFLFLFIFLCFLFTIFEYHKNQEIEKYLTYLLFEKDGTFSLRDQQFSILWKSNLNKSLVSTNIQVNNLNFDEKNLLPGDNGKLYLINTKKDEYEMMNTTISDVINATSFYSGLGFGEFFGKIKTTFYVVNLENGEVLPFEIGRIMKEVNDGIIVIQRTEYFLQLKQYSGELIWEASLSEIDIKRQKIEIDEKFQKFSNFVKKYENGMYLFKYDKKNGVITKQIFEHNIKNNIFDKIFKKFKIYGKIICIDFLLIGISLLWYYFDCNYLSLSNKLEKKISPPLTKQNKQNDTSSPENNSRLSTVSITEKSLENKKNISNSYSHPKKINFSKILNKIKTAKKIQKKLSIDETELKKSDFAENQNQISLTSLNLNSLSPTRCLSRQQSEASILPKKKYTSSPELLEELGTLSSLYIKEANKATNKSNFRIDDTDSANKKYIEMYKLINNQSENSNNTNSDNDSYQSQILNLNPKNLYLIDTGRFMSNFEQIQLVGKGGFGSVFRAIHKIDGSYYAIKILKFNISPDENLSKIKEVQEIKTMMKVEHKNIVRYITCWFELEDQDVLNKRGRALSMDEKLMTINKKKNDNIFGDNKVNEFELVIDDNNNKKITNFVNSSVEKEDKKSNDSDDYEDYGLDIEEEKEIQFGSFDESCLIFEEDENKNKKEDSQNESFTNSADIKINIGFKRAKKITYPVYFYMQMEYCEGCPLSFYLQNRKEHSPLNLITNIFYQIAKAVKHIHGKNIIHRDLKPANIFIHGDFKIKIGDFGLAEEKRQNLQIKDQVGTFLYQSPEQLDGKEYNEKVDIYALGLILLEMCIFCKTESERRQILLNVRKGKYPSELNQFQQEYELIQKMTFIDPNKRYSIDEVLNSDQMWCMLENL